MPGASLGASTPAGADRGEAIAGPIAAASSHR
jgi:hypothetical protein